MIAFNLNFTLGLILHLLAGLTLLCSMGVSAETGSIKATEQVHTLSGSVDELNRSLPNSNIFIDTLRLALMLTEPEYGPFALTLEDRPMHPEREFKSLGQGKLDIIWAMTSKQREASAIPIRVPVTYGLFGYRVLAVGTGEKSVFSQPVDLPTLKRLTAVQGQYWPDSDILQSNGFTVERTIIDSNIYRLLEQGFFDYYPRSVAEVDAELDYYQNTKKLNVGLESHTLLYYPTAMYFFVSTARPNLAKRITKGLAIADEQGSRRALFEQTKMHQRLLEKSQGRRIIKLTNPFLTDETKAIVDKFTLRLGEHNE